MGSSNSLLDEEGDNEMRGIEKTTGMSPQTQIRQHSQKVANASSKPRRTDDATCIECDKAQCDGAMGTSWRNIVDPNAHHRHNLIDCFYLTFKDCIGTPFYPLSL